jgi:pimeloyl-ACP methyl ester carboxylesterase
VYDAQVRQTDFHTFRNNGGERAIVLVHGFNEDVEQTWAPFASLLAAERELAGYDIYSFGYRSSLAPPTLWAGNASLTSLAIQLFSRLELRDMARYAKLALIGHSSGGLVIQRALVSYPKLVAKTSHVCLFATPSGGARPIYSLYFWNPQLRDLSRKGPFIREVRRYWAEMFGTYTPFWFRVVAGEQDHFVPVESVIGPYAKDFVRMYAGDHASLIRPNDRNAGPVQLLTEGLRIPEGISGRVPRTPWDAFLSYNKLDVEEATKLAGMLQERGLRIWMDDASLSPGEAWAISLETVAKSVPAALVLIGPHGLGKTQSVEIYQFDPACTIIPVVLSTCTEIPEIPAELHGKQRVDLRKRDSHAIFDMERAIREAVERRRGAGTTA